jgi:chromosome segregation protein
VLSAIYIKGFKTFARPVRMPIEGGVTAIVGPNGSGKSNITDAVLFALGEQSSGMLRAGAMGDLIFSGSDSLPAANVAEVTLVIDNASGEVSLPYEEVSLSRRISRDGGTEYRINGTRARMADVRAVAGEVGLGRHSILRQGAVDAIVSGGAEACRQALEEAAGLGVYRRRRVSTSRRLEKADAQLEQSRRIEAELSDQLRRIEREAVAAREYREIEARFRELSLAHLYRVANRESEGARRKLEEARKEVEELSGHEKNLRDEEKSLARNLSDSERELRTLEGTIEGLEEGIEGLRGESLRMDRGLFRLEAGRGNGEERRNSLARLEAEARRVEGDLETLRVRRAKVEEEYSSAVAVRDEKRRASKLAREKSDEAERSRSRLAAEIEGLETRFEALEAEEAAVGTSLVPSSEDVARMEAVARSLERDPSSEARERAESLLSLVGELRRGIEASEAEANRRRGSLSVAVGRVESRARSLREAAPGSGGGVRLYEVVRARPGFENAVEAALGEFGAGVLARDVVEGVRMLSETQRIAIRLDAERAEDHGGLPGTPLLECVDIVDERFADSVERLLGGIYVVDDAESNHLTNGYVAVTKEGIRLTRTSVSLVASGGFAREARLAESVDLLEDLEAGPGKILRNIHAKLSRLSERLEASEASGRSLASLARRTRRIHAALASEARRRLAAAGKSREASSRRTDAISRLKNELSEKKAALEKATETLKSSQRELSSTAAGSDAAQSAAEESGRQRKRLRAAISEGEKRKNSIEARLEKARASASATDSDEAPRLAARIRSASERLSATSSGRRSALRMNRAEKTESFRRLSSRQNSLARDAAEAGAALAAARSEVERIEDSLRRAAEASSLAEEEIREEWAATLEDAERESRKHPEDAEPERNKLARKLKRFGDVNLLALSQESEMRERYETISAQRQDAEEAADELGRIIRSIDEEIEVRFSETFSRVKRTFSEMVPRMMAGASGTLDLSEEGVEIGIRLGRKGWRSLTVLSGGERSLLALSFLFSILLSRGDSAETFCILDEAEAALDDVNLARFISVVDSHRANGRFILVTHQKRTMAAADVLYGAVQDASGATSVVSKRIQGD